jgi:hypothetical protein
LVDLLVHEQDIRIQLGQSKPMPVDALRLVFSSWDPGKSNIGERVVGIGGRVKGLQFTANDLGITKGQGLAIEGNAQDILLAVTGRSGSIAKLRGGGVELLKSRLS